MVTMTRSCLYLLNEDQKIKEERDRVLPAAMRREQDGRPSSSGFIPQPSPWRVTRSDCPFYPAKTRFGYLNLAPPRFH